MSNQLSGVEDEINYMDFVTDGNAEGSGDERDNLEIENPLAHLPEYVLARVAKLKTLDEKRQELVEDYIVERAEFEKKFSCLFETLYTARAAIVCGESYDKIPVSGYKGDDIEATRQALESLDHEASQVEGIPHFWVTAMASHETISEWITESDVECLQYLSDITCTDRDDGKGFQLFFHFGPNDYFENKYLTKSYEVPNLLLLDEPKLKVVNGTSIQWKPHKCLTHRFIKKKQRGKGKHAGQLRTVQKREELDSFFKWFDVPAMPMTMDVKEAEELEAIYEEDYEMAVAFRNEIIPRAVLWFTGEALEVEERNSDESPHEASAER